MIKLRSLLEMLFEISAISDDRKEIFMTVFMSEDENQMVEVLLEFTEEYSDRSYWIEFVKKIEEITKTESRLLKAALSQLSTGVTAEDFILNINSLRDTGNLAIAQQEIRGVISNWEQDNLSKQLVEFFLNDFPELLNEREDLEAILLSVVSKYKPVFKKTNLQADAEFFKRLQKIAKEKGIGVFFSYRFPQSDSQEKQPHMTLNSRLSLS